MKAIEAGKFVVTGEIVPKKSATFDEVLETARILRSSVVACNVTDNPRAQAYLSSIAVSHVIQDNGVEAICQMTVRDRNRLSIISDLLAASALGIRNVLTMSGDHTSLSDNPAAMPVYDIDTAQFVRLVRAMVDEGVDLAGNKIVGKVKMHVGIVGNPNNEPQEIELLKIERKVRLGADFMQTQIVFDVEKAKHFLDAMKKYDMPVLVGMFPCKSYGTANYMSTNVPGISMPAEFIEALKKTEDLPVGVRSTKVDEINFDFFSGLISEIRRTTRASGVHLMAPGYESMVKKLSDFVDLR